MYMRLHYVELRMTVYVERHELQIYRVQYVHIMQWDLYIFYYALLYCAYQSNF